MSGANGFTPRARAFEELWDCLKALIRLNPTDGFDRRNETLVESERKGGIDVAAVEWDEEDLLTASRNSKGGHLLLILQYIKKAIQVVNSAELTELGFPPIHRDSRSRAQLEVEPEAIRTFVLVGCHQNRSCVSFFPSYILFLLHFVLFFLSFFSQSALFLSVFLSDYPQQ